MTVLLGSLTVFASCFATKEEPSSGYQHLFPTGQKSERTSPRLRVRLRLRHSPIVLQRLDLQLGATRRAQRPLCVLPPAKLGRALLCSETWRRGRVGEDLVDIAGRELEAEDEVVVLGELRRGLSEGGSDGGEFGSKVEKEILVAVEFAGQSGRIHRCFAVDDAHALPPVDAESRAAASSVSFSASSALSWFTSAAEASRSSLPILRPSLPSGNDRNTPGSYVPSTIRVPLAFIMRSKVARPTWTKMPRRSISDLDTASS